jgi:putative transposase
MSILRRLKDSRTQYFITCVTFDRKPILREFGYLCLECLQEITRAKSVALTAWVIMPDHYHMVVDVDHSTISSFVQSAKQSFSKKYRKQTSHQGKVWQLRFWGHIIRDEGDFRNHLDYIHYNPVKHGVATDPFLYPLSSAGVYLEKGQYGRDWGVVSIPEFSGEFGE